MIPDFNSFTLFYVLMIVAGVVLLWLGYRVGRLFAGVSSSKVLAAKEQELFSAQRGFKTVYEQEIAQLKDENASLKDRVKALEVRVEEYRRKAAGLGGLFSSSNKKSDAMYALLLENEALEEALLQQNEKLRNERGDIVKEQIRASGYRRVLMSQLLNDERIKGYVAEILADDKRLPGPGESQSVAADERG